jgi:hypothetical protein
MGMGSFNIIKEEGLFMLKKLLPIVLVLTLLFSSAPLSIVKAADSNDVSEEFLSEEINQEDLDLEATDEGLQVTTEVDFDSESVNEEVLAEDEEIPLEEVDSAETVLDVNIDEGTVTLNSTLFDEDGNEYSKDYNVIIEKGDEEGVKATFVDLETGEEYAYDSTELSASWAFAIPIGINIGRAALSLLFATGAAITISGVTYIAYKEFSKKKRSYNHYMASRQSGGLYIGNGLSKTKAVARLAGNKDTWSSSKSNAQTIAKAASPLKKAVGAEIDKNGKGKHYHYHPVGGKKDGKYVRMLSHAFYGAGR